MDCQLVIERSTRYDAYWPVMGVISETRRIAFAIPDICSVPAVVVAEFRDQVCRLTFQATAFISGVADHASQIPARALRIVVNSLAAFSSGGIVGGIIMVF